MSIHNDARFVAESINSVLKQSICDFEFIIVDDGSTDSSPDVIASFRDERIKLVTLKRSGLAHALNQALTLARGEYVARQDGDDISVSERLERQVAYLQSNEAVGVLGTAITAIDENGRELRDYEYPCSDAQIRDQLYRMKNPLVHGSLMYRRQLILDIDGYRPIFLKSEDYDMHLRAAPSVRFAVTPERLLKYRIRLDSMSADSNGTALLYSMFARALEAVRQRGGDAPSERALRDYQCAFERWFTGKSFARMSASGYYRRAAMLSWYSARRFRSLRLMGVSVWHDPLWPVRERLVRDTALWTPRIEQEIIDLYDSI